MEENIGMVTSNPMGGVIDILTFS